MLKVYINKEKIQAIVTDSDRETFTIFLDKEKLGLPFDSHLIFDLQEFCKK